MTSDVMKPFTAKEIAEETSVTIELKGMRGFSIRLWIAVKLINLAKLISWFDIEIKFILDNPKGE